MMKQDAIKLYEYLFRITSGSKTFVCKLRGRDELIVDNFIKKLTESYGKDWLFNYMTYQFARYAEQETTFGKGTVMVGWVFGQKALKKFKEASLEELYFRDKFIVDYKVKNILFEREPLDASEYRHKERKRFYGSDRGLIHCTTMTNLYDEKHRDCMFCKFKNYCK